MLRKINNEKGSTLMLVILGFFIVAIFTMTGIFISNASSKRTVKEEHRTKAYYVAQTGAKTFINHIEKEAKAGKDVLKELKELDGKTSKSTPYELSKDGKDYGEFDIKVEGIETKDKDDSKKTESYKIITTGRVKTQKVELVAIINPQFDGGGYDIGNGRIFSNSDEKIVVQNVPQLTGAGISIYMNPKKYDDNVPFSIGNPNPVRELFMSISDRISKLEKPNTGDIYALNNQTGNNYRLEIQEPTDKSLKVSKSDPIKREKLVRYKANGEKDEKFKELQFLYDTNRKDVLDYFAKGKLSGGPMTDAEIEEGLKSVFLLPITTKDDYEKYIDPTIKENPIYPPAPSYDGKITRSANLPSVLSGSKNIDISNGETVKIDAIEISENGQLTISTTGDCNIVMGGELVIKDSSESSIKIKATGKVNIYTESKMNIYGKLIVEGNGSKNEQVNIYMKKGSGESDDGFVFNGYANVKNVNIYAPHRKIALYKADYEGVIVGAQIDFNNKDSTFKAPSSGPASKGSTSSSEINVEWKN